MVVKMKIDIVCTTKSKYIKCVADEMARWVKTYVHDLKDYHENECVDLLVIGFDDTLFEDKELLNASLSKAYQLCDKAVSKGILHKNTAARKKSRLTKAVNKLQAK